MDEIDGGKAVVAFSLGAELGSELGTELGVEVGVELGASDGWRLVAAFDGL